MSDMTPSPIPAWRIELDAARAARRASLMDPLLPSTDEMARRRRQEDGAAAADIGVGARKVFLDKGRVLGQRTNVRNSFPTKCDHRAVIADHIAGMKQPEIAVVHGISVRQVKRIVAEYRR
jgi:hypothetical protein